MGVREALLRNAIGEEICCRFDVVCAEDGWWWWRVVLDDGSAFKFPMRYPSSAAALEALGEFLDANASEVPLC